MNAGLKVFLYLVLLTASCVCGIFFRVNYVRLYDDSAITAEKAQAEEETPEQKQQLSQYYSKVMTFGALFFVSTLGWGFLLAHDIATFFGTKAGHLIYNDSHADAARSQEYEKADEIWRNGDYLTAIQMLRDYLKKNPREIHAAIRIGEIYEKDLHNHLAAALEYEEVLKHKLKPERWAWLAIRLSNIYSGKLNQMDKSMAILQRIDNEYGQTKAAAKARKRLAQLEGGEAVSAEEDANLPAAE